MWQLFSQEQTVCMMTPIKNTVHMKYSCLVSPTNHTASLPSESLRIELTPVVLQWTCSRLQTARWDLGYICQHSVSFLLCCWFGILCCRTPGTCPSVEAGLWFVPAFWHMPFADSNTFLCLPYVTAAKLLQGFCSIELQNNIPHTPVVMAPFHK